jgi:hypothetical protein
MHHQWIHDRRCQQGNISGWCPLRHMSYLKHVLTRSGLMVRVTGPRQVMAGLERLVRLQLGLAGDSSGSSTAWHAQDAVSGEAGSSKDKAAGDSSSPGRRAVAAAAAALLEQVLLAECRGSGTSGGSAGGSKEGSSGSSADISSSSKASAGSGIKQH